MKVIVLAALVAMFTIVGAQSQSYASYTCPFGWDYQHSFEFTIKVGESCCKAGAHVCSRLTVGGDLEVMVGAVWVELPCGENLTVAQVRDKALGLALQSGAYPFSQVSQIPPCSQGTSSYNVKTYTSQCGIYINQIIYVGNPQVPINVKVMWPCADLHCIKQCTVCFNDSDECNEGTRNLTISCNDVYVPTSTCPTNCNGWGSCN